MTNPLGYGISKLGRWSRRIHALNALLTDGELPGNAWRFLDERTWRFSDFPKSKEGEIFDRAVKNGGFIVWRSFESKRSTGGVWVQINQFASVQDAEASIPNNSLGFKENSKFRGVPGEDRQVGGYKLPGIQLATFFERPSTNGHEESTTRFVCGNVQNVVFVVACTDSGVGVPWEDAISIAMKQARKIEEVLGKNQ